MFFPNVVGFSEQYPRKLAKYAAAALMGYVVCLYFMVA